MHVSHRGTSGDDPPIIMYATFVFLSTSPSQLKSVFYQTHLCLGWIVAGCDHQYEHQTIYTFRLKFILEVGLFVVSSGKMHIFK